MRVLFRLPLVRNLAGYRRRWLLDDLGAALVLTTLLIPAGMGYAQAAGLPAVTGLYATISALVVYALLGPSRVLVYGPDSSLAALIAAAVLPLAAGDEGRAVVLAGLLAVLTGALCLLAGVARFGFLADLLSAPVRVGYLNGIAVSVIIRQLAPLYGVRSEGGNPLTMLGGTVAAVFEGGAHGPTVLIGALSLAGIVAVRRIAPKVPATLLAIAVPAAIGAVIDLPARGVATVGRLPRGLPSVDWSLLRIDDVAALAVAAVGIAFIAFADTSVLSRTVALRRKDHVDPNHELLALGATNVVAGLTGGFAVSSSSSRTPVAEAAGSRSQLTGLFGAASVALVLLVAPAVLRNVPTASLAAVVIMAAAGLIDVRSWQRWASVRRNELLLSVGAFAAVVALGVIPGIALAIGVSLLEFMRRAWRPHSAVLVRVDGLKGYHEAERHPEGRAVPGLVLYRFDAPLFFANAGFFVADLLAQLQPDTRQVTVTAEPITDIDATAAETIGTLLDELARRQVVLTFAELKGHVRDQLDAYGLVERVGRSRFSRTVGEAVKDYVHTHEVAWQDWEDR
ncbi:MAG: SulP family inorganic anion transporter [Acidimicrobiales bacterium]|nr:SulP family inorganic anion transporter [Acidimicrobiales bacterium]